MVLGLPKTPSLAPHVVGVSGAETVETVLNQTLKP